MSSPLWFLVLVLTFISGICLGHGWDVPDSILTVGGVLLAIVVVILFYSFVIMGVKWG